MAYHTVSYLFVFLPLVLCLYQFAPGKARWLVLLLAGYAFLWTFDGRMALWLAASSLFTHYICVLITLAREKQASVPVCEKQGTALLREKQVSSCKNILVFGIVTLLCLWLCLSLRKYILKWQYVLIQMYIRRSRNAVR